MRRIFVGDVQGCREPLERLLRATGFAAGRDRLFLAGDLVNKGPDSLGVLRRARELGAEAVLGNHDVHLLEAADGRRPARPGDDFEEVLAAADRDALLGWLWERPVLLPQGDVALVHAAVRPGWSDLEATAARLRERFEECWRAGVSPFADDDVRFALTARWCTAAGEQADADWPPPPQPYANWVEFYRGPAIVVFGHFARQGLAVTEWTRGLDSGCVYGNRLSAWVAEEDRVVSVECPRAA